MLRTGIYDLSQITNGVKTEDWYGLPKPISITLYPLVRQLANGEEWAERILNSYANERGAYKRTYANRFEEFDREMLAIIQQSFLPDKLLNLHDIGVSDARTAVDFYHKLKATSRQLDFWASDYDPEVLALEQGARRLVVSVSGQALELVVPPYVFNLSRPESWKRYPFNRMLLAYHRRATLPGLQAQYQRAPQSCQRIQLFCPQALTLAEQNSNFHLVQYDLLIPWQRTAPLQIIRAMNVFNPSYFQPAEIQRVIGNVFEALEISGLLLSGSNQDAHTQINGGVYQKAETGFRLLRQFGSGHPWQNEILNWRRPA